MREQSFHRGPGSDFTAILAADSVGESEQPSQNPSFVGGSGSSVAKEILIVLANFPRIGEFCEFQFQHGAPGKSLAARARLSSGGAE